VRRGRDRKKFRKALHDGKEDDVPESHIGSLRRKRDGWMKQEHAR
jgi:hypothetical protein